MKRYVLGVPSYANTAPLYHHLPECLKDIPLEVELKTGVPSELNHWLDTGEVDLSLVSSYYYLQHQNKLNILPDFSVSCYGPVYSVCLFSKVEPQHIKRIAQTNQSATSVALLGHWLRCQQLQPECITSNATLQSLQDPHLDAVLLIGDQALKAFELQTALNQPLHIVDLAQAWYTAEHLPFVFAVWATSNQQQPPAEVLQALHQSRLLGLGNLAHIAQQESSRVGVSANLMQHYLWNFRYHLEAPDRMGLERFATLLGFEPQLHTWPQQGPAWL